MVGAFKPNPLRDICAALEIDDLSADPRYCDLTQQFKNKAALQAIFRERYAGNTREHWLARLEAVDILCSPVRDLREALVDPQTLHNQMLIEGDGEGQRALHQQPDHDVQRAGQPAPRAAQARAA